MFGEKSFLGTPKTSDKLDVQLNKVQERLGSEPELSLVPSSIDREKILHMSMAELQATYARRYEMYIAILRKNKNGDFVSREELILNFKKWLTGLNSLDAYIAKHNEGIDVTLRGKQIDVFDDLHKFLEKGGTAGYVKLPTGVGKTVLFTELIEALDLKTLIIVPTNILVRQTVDKAHEFAPDIDVGVINQVAKQYGRKVTVTTYASLARQVAKGLIKPEEFECLILDEAHEALSDDRKQLVRSFTNAAKIGFSATPNFSGSKRLDDLLPECIHAMELRESIEGGLSCSVSAVIAKTTVDISKVKKDRSGEFSEVELEQAVNIVSRNKAAALLYKEYFSGELAVVYCAGINHAHAAAAMFREEGVSAAAISGKTPKKEQEELLERFHNGEIKVLCNSDLLIRGFDEPRVSVCLNLRPTVSYVNAEQRGGRVLRLDPNRPDKHATVVDFIDQGGGSEEFERTGAVPFAKILGGAFLAPRNTVEVTWGKGGWIRRGGERDKTPMINIPGLQVFFDAEEIMKIVGRVELVKREKIYLIRNLDQLKAEVRIAGVQGVADYAKKLKLNPSWPSEPRDLSGWVDWFDFLGKPKAELIKDLSVLKAEVSAAGVQTRDEYKIKRAAYSMWPSTPDKFYPDWTSWTDFFGKKEVKIIKDILVLQTAVQVAEVRGLDDYHVKRIDRPDWPSRPDYLPGWLGWHDFLRKPNIKIIKYLSVLKTEVQAAGIQSVSDYKKMRREHPEWPSNPRKIFSDWISWYDLLGKNKLS